MVIAIVVSDVGVVGAAVSDACVFDVNDLWASVAVVDAILFE